ncbi:multidrug effflux MFS transporter [Streptomyces sp. NPDC000594]|uniref:multidrug effflux MFS transporter n=1 Tax=Streptomyces sp. NPDC000594 TaxID=3154261 RepID=UPI00331BB651
MPVLTGALALLCVVGPLSTDMYLPAFPGMARELGTDASGIQLTLTAFLIGMTLGHLVFGPLSDRYGRRGPLLAGAAVCALATAGCALAPSLEWLVAARFLAGFSGAAGVVISRAVVSDVAEGAAAARMLALLMTLSTIAPIVAPLAGGAIIELSGWRAVFWVLTAVAALVAAAVVAGIPESLPEERRITGGFGAFARSVRTVVADRAYTGWTLAFTFGFGALFCYIAGSPFLLQNVLGLGVGMSSVAFSGGALMAGVTGALSARIVTRTGPERLLRLGLYAMLAGCTALLLATVAGVLTVAVCLPLLAVVTGGIGLAFANAAALAIGRVPHAAGTGSALLGTAQSALGAVVAPLVGLGGADTALPLFAGMTLCTVLAVGSARWALRAAGTGTGSAGSRAPVAPAP